MDANEQAAQARREEYPYERAERLAREQQKSRDCDTNPATTGCASGETFTGQGVLSGLGTYTNLYGRLRAEHGIHVDRRRELARALNILERHPEFEDLIWLIRSGLV
jgi:hypothetical protein